MNEATKNAVASDAPLGVRWEATAPHRLRMEAESAEETSPAHPESSPPPEAKPRARKRRGASLPAALQGAFALARRLAKCAALLLAVLWVAWLLLPKPDLLPPGAEFSRVVLDRDGRVLFITLTTDGKYRLPAKLGDLSPEMITSTRP